MGKLPASTVSLRLVTSRSAYKLSRLDFCRAQASTECFGLHAGKVPLPFQGAVPAHCQLAPSIFWNPRPEWVTVSPPTTLAPGPCSSRNWPTTLEEVRLKRDARHACMHMHRRQSLLGSVEWYRADSSPKIPRRGYWPCFQCVAGYLATIRDSVQERYVCRPPARSGDWI